MTFTAWSRMATGPTVGPISTSSWISWRRPAALVTSGDRVPGGKPPMMAARRSPTSWRERQGSVPPSKAMTTWTRPACTVLTTRFTPGRPPTACSTGWATVSSSSEAARPGLWMSSCSEGSERSGMRSRFRLKKVSTPRKASSSVAP